jgi:hypothetical protein
MGSGYRYKTRFEPNQGYHFYRDSVSILIRALSYGRRFTEEQNASYVRHINQFFDALKSVDAPIPSPRKPLIEADFADLSDEPLYKYVSDSTWKYLSDGSFQFGTAKYYRETSNIYAQDRHEGAATFHLTNNENQLNVSIVSGMNCALFCGTSLLDGSDHKLMLEKFGRKRIKIHPLKDFVALVKTHIGAYSARTDNVIYTDLKNYIAELRGIERFAGISGSGASTDSNRRKLRQINETFFSTFYEYGFMPSLFAKPTSYAEERERRIVFETRADLRTPTVVVNDKSLLNYVTLVDGT